MKDLTLRKIVLTASLIGGFAIGTPAAEAVFIDVFDIIGTATDQGDGTWAYSYKINADEAPNGLSHWWLELTAFKADSIFDPSGPNEGTDWNPEFPSFGEPLAAPLVTAQGVDLSGGDSDLFGIKWEAPSDSDFQDGMLTGFSFLSTHGPSAPDAYTWFAKFGREGYDFGQTIGPNGAHSVVPEPGTLVLTGLGLFGLGRARRRQLRKK